MGDDNFDLNNPPDPNEVAPEHAWLRRRLAHGTELFRRGGEEIKRLREEVAGLKKANQVLVSLRSHPDEVPESWRKAMAAAIPEETSRLYEAAMSLRGLCRLCLIMCRNRGIEQMADQLANLLERTSWLDRNDPQAPVR